MTVQLTVTTVADLRAIVAAWKSTGETVALVPTMGALHAGQLALVHLAQTLARRVVVSIFVNPLQFGPQEDLGRYPRPLAQDQALLAEAGCDLLFNPSVEEVYGAGAVTRVEPGPLGDVWDGAARPGHFTGVATVVTKLLLMAQPDIAVFGEKDYQQLLVIRQVVGNLNIPVQIMGAPIARDTDGLALSSRNIYLSADERQSALALPHALQAAKARLLAGNDVAAVLRDGRAALEQAKFEPDYFALVDAGDLSPVTDFAKPARLLAAATIGTTRLIDNCAVML